MRLFVLMCLFAAVAYAQQCGDGVLDDGEACDDGNTFNDDGCTFNCEIEDRFICRDEPSVCFPIVPDSCLPPPQERPTEETTTTENQSTDETTTEESTTESSTSTTRSRDGSCPPISCPSDCEFGTHKYRLSRDSNGCQFCRCVLRRVPLDDGGDGEDDDNSGRDRGHGRRRRAFNSTTAEPTTTTIETTTEFTTLFTTTENPPTTDDNQCPVNPIFITNCTCQPNFRVFWEFINDCPTCHCVPIEDDQTPPVGDICVGDTTTFGENCTCSEECHACQWDGETGDCLVCTSLFLFRGSCLDACPNGTVAQGNEDFRRRCVVIRTGETTTEAPTTTEVTTTEETTTEQTTTEETTTEQTTTAETTTAETTTAETTTAETTTAESTTVATTTAESTTGETTTAESTTNFNSTTAEATTAESTTNFNSTTAESTTNFNSTTEETTTEEGNTTTVVIPVCNGLPDPLICLNFTLNCTNIVGNITVNETCPVLCNTCNVTTSTATVVITTTPAPTAAIIEGASIANNVASASNTANPGLIVGMSVLAVVLVAAAVGLVVHRRRQRRNMEDEVVVGPPEVRVEEVGQARN